jgi:hypothetical protein
MERDLPHPNSRLTMAPARPRSDNARVAFTQYRHYFSQFLDTRCASLPDGRRRSRFDLTLVKLTRQKALDDGYLLVLPLSELGAVTLPIEGDRFAALLDHCLQHALDFGLGKAVRIALPALGDIPFLERRQD